MSLTFTRSTKVPEGGNFVDLRGSNALVGTLTFAGSYATGGDTFTTGKTIEDLLKQIGAGRVLAILTSARGHTLEWNDTTKKLLVYVGGAELAAAAYPAILTASPVPFVVMGR